MKNIVIFDTNVLLSDPNALFIYPDTEVIIPQIVLSELDKIKVSRSDKDVRFRGREVSRILFDLSQHGTLLEGIDLDNDASIRVAQYEADDFPKTLSPRNADDRILACAIQEQEKNPDAQVTLLTNDLNMLLKAQTFGIEVGRHEHEFKPSLLNKMMSRLGRKRFSWWWMAFPVVLIGLSLSLWLFVPSPIPVGTTSSALELTSFPLKEVEYLTALNKDSTDFHSWFLLGQLYSRWARELESSANFPEEREKLSAAVDAYRHALALEPTNAAARTSLGTAYYFLGNTDEAISQYVQATSYDPTYALPHFSLGFALLNRQDPIGAARSFEAYLKLEPNGERSTFARQKLQEITGSQQ